MPPQKYWRAVVTYGNRAYIENGFTSEEAAIKAARVYAAKHKRGLSGFRAEPE